MGAVDGRGRDGRERRLRARRFGPGRKDRTDGRTGSPAPSSRLCRARSSGRSRCLRSLQVRLVPYFSDRCRAVLFGVELAASCAYIESPAFADCGGQVTVAENRLKGLDRGARTAREWRVLQG